MAIDPTGVHTHIATNTTSATSKFTKQFTSMKSAEFQGPFVVYTSILHLYLLLLCLKAQMLFCDTTTSRLSCILDVQLCFS